MAPVEAADAWPEEPTHDRPLARHDLAEDGKAKARVEIPKRMPEAAGHCELDHRDPAAGLHHARELAHGRGGVLDVPQEIRERQMVERLVRERDALGPSFDELLEDAGPLPRDREHVGALVEPDDAAAVAPHKRLGDHARAGRDVEHAIAGTRSDRVDERAAPARILAEREDRTDAVVRPADAGEDAFRIARDQRVESDRGAHGYAVSSTRGSRPVWER